MYYTGESVKLQPGKTVKNQAEVVGVFGSYQKWCSNVPRRSTVKQCEKKQQLAAEEKESNRIVALIPLSWVIF